MRAGESKAFFLVAVFGRAAGLGADALAVGATIGEPSGKNLATGGYHGPLAG